MSTNAARAKVISVYNDDAVQTVAKALTASWRNAPTGDQVRKAKAVLDALWDDGWIVCKREKP